MTYLEPYDSCYLMEVWLCGTMGACPKCGPCTRYHVDWQNCRYGAPSACDPFYCNWEE
jgi:hypothetical protein